MKVIVSIFLLVIGMSAHAETYSEESGSRSGCYQSYPAPDILEPVEQKALASSCELAQETCYEKHSKSFPRDEFTCEVQLSRLLSSSNTGNTNGDVTCANPDHYMAVATAKCTVQVRITRKNH